MVQNYIYLGLYIYRLPDCSIRLHDRYIQAIAATKMFGLQHVGRSVGMYPEWNTDGRAAAFGSFAARSCGFTLRSTVSRRDGSVQNSSCRK